MDNRNIEFKKVGSMNYTIITFESCAENIYDTINALLTLLSCADVDIVNNDERYSVCTLIQALVPTREQMKTLEKMQLGNQAKEKDNTFAK